MARPVQTVGILGLLRVRGLDSPFVLNAIKAPIIAMLAEELSANPNKQSEWSVDGENDLAFFSSYTGTDLVVEKLVTVVRNTLITIEVRRKVPSEDKSELNNAHNTLRELLNVSLARLAHDNDFTPHENTSAIGAASGQVLRAYIAFFWFGGVSLVAISLRPFFRQAGLVALIALGGGLLYQSIPGNEIYTGYRLGDLIVYALLLLGLLLIVNGLLSVFLASPSVQRASPNICVMQFPPISGRQPVLALSNQKIS